jgi:hypothetical protein
MEIFYCHSCTKFDSAYLKKTSFYDLYAEICEKYSMQRPF